MSGPTRTPEDLMADIQRYLNLSVADSAKQTYSTGEKSSIEFLSLYRPLHAQSTNRRGHFDTVCCLPC